MHIFSDLCSRYLGTVTEKSPHHIWLLLLSLPNNFVSSQSVLLQANETFIFKSAPAGYLPYWQFHWTKNKVLVLRWTSSYCFDFLSTHVFSENEKSLKICVCHRSIKTVCVLWFLSKIFFFKSLKQNYVIISMNISRTREDK